MSNTIEMTGILLGLWGNQTVKTKTGSDHNATCPIKLAVLLWKCNCPLVSFPLLCCSDCPSLPWLFSPLPKLPCLYIVCISLGCFTQRLSGSMSRLLSHDFEAMIPFPPFPHFCPLDTKGGDTAELAQWLVPLLGFSFSILSFNYFFSIWIFTGTAAKRSGEQSRAAEWRRSVSCLLCAECKPFLPFTLCFVRERRGQTSAHRLYTVHWMFKSGLPNFKKKSLK